MTLVCRKQYGTLFLETGVVDEVIPEDSLLLLPLFDARASSGGDFAAWLGSFDSVIVWTQENPESFLLKTSGIQAGSTRPYILQANPGEQELLSRVFFRKTVESTGVTDFPPVEEWPKLPLKCLSKEPGPRIVVHPGSGSETKRWPLQNFLKIIEELGENDIPGALVTGEAEEKMAAAIEKMALPFSWTWIRCPSILGLARLLSAADLYLGNDSGVTHLAAACGAEVVALFRTEFASAWRPLGRVELLSAASINEISLEAVHKIVFSRIKN